MPFVFAADAGFEVPLAVAMSSLVERNCESTPHILVLDGGILPEARSAITRFLEPRATLDWVRPAPGQLGGTDLAGPSRLSDAAKYRLLLPDLVPGVDRVVYVDADTVIRDSLVPLQELLLGDEVLAAVPDAGSPLAAGSSGPDWRELGLSPDAPYFNSGVLVIPLDTWRRIDVTERAIGVLRERTPRWGDQDALNAVAGSNWMALPRRFNVQLNDVTGRTVSWALWPDEVEAALGDPAIVHFNGHSKPWHVACAHPWSDIWWQALDGTPWNAWRPKRVGRLQRLAAKAGRALRAELAGPR